MLILIGIKAFLGLLVRAAAFLVGSGFFAVFAGPIPPRLFLPLLPLTDNCDLRFVNRVYGPYREHLRLCELASFVLLQ